MSKTFTCVWEVRVSGFEVDFGCSHQRDSSALNESDNIPLEKRCNDHESDQHLHHLKGNTSQASKRCRGSFMMFSEWVNIFLISTGLSLSRLTMHSSADSQQPSLVQRYGKHRES